MRALDRWRHALSLDELNCLPKILPKLNHYLSNKTEEELVSDYASDEITGAQTLHNFILQFLGHIGGLGHGVVGSLTAHLKNGLRWDTSQQVRIAFHLDIENTFGLPLDDLIPKIIDLAESGSVNSKSKLPACEILHSIILYMLPMRDQNRLCKIYRKIFPSILRLSSDAHEITRKMFEPLVKQLVHWFEETKRGRQSNNARNGSLAIVLLTGVEW